MPSKIGEAILVIKANAKGLKTGLDNAQQTVSSKFGKMEKRLQGFAGKVPIVGGQLSGLGGPALVASAAIGIAVTAVAGMVKKTLDLGRELGESREKLEVSAEGIQIWRRAIEETNGSADSFDAVIIRMRDSIGSANQGNKEAQDGFDALGLSWEDLADKSPEQALQDILTAANDTLDPTDAAAIKADLLGKSYTGLGGLANDSGEEIQALLDKVEDSAVVMSGDAVTSVDEYDEAMREMRDTMGKVAIAVGTKLIPKITSLITAIMDIGTELWPVINIMITPLKNAFDIIFGAIDVVASLLRGDFRGAWDAVLDTALSVMGNLVEVYNNTIAKIPGVAKIDMAKVRGALEGVRAKTDDELNPALEDTKEAMDDAAGSTRDMTAATGELETAEKTAAERIADTRQAIEDGKQAADDAEAGLSDGMLPTLDELIATMAEAETATDDTAESVRDLTSDTISFSEEGSEALTAAELSQARSYENIQAKAEETALKAEELATRQAEAAQKAADATQAAADRINSSWDGFITKQDENDHSDG